MSIPYASRKLNYFTKGIPFNNYSTPPLSNSYHFIEIRKCPNQITIRNMRPPFINFTSQIYHYMGKSQHPLKTNKKKRTT